MNKLIFFLFIFQITYSQDIKVHSTISYLDIKLSEYGHLPSNPYILEFKNGIKEVVFCGVEHLPNNSDIDNEMYTVIEKKFNEIRPSIAINEGGEMSNKYYVSKKEAIRKDGEIGLLKILSDSLGIQTINGDPYIDFELIELSKTYSKSDILTYIVTERLMWNLFGNKVFNSVKIEKEFNQFIENYIMKQGKLSLSNQEKSFNFFKKNYQKLVNRKFDIKTLKPTNPFDSIGTFQAIGRKSKEIRDQYLLNTIEKLLKTNDKVFIVFGGWHLLTCEPGLKEIIANTN